MSRGHRIVAIGTPGQEAGTGEFILTEEADPPIAEEGTLELADLWDEEMPAAEPAWQRFAAPLLAGLAIAGWSAAFVWTKFAGPAPSLAQALDWIADWSGPVLLICVGWLLAMRHSRREAARFGDAARLLGIESDKLSDRLTTVNGELSMAREFIAAQARDLESLGRIAVERLSQNAESLQALIQTNSAQIETIGTVSDAALDNMEKLRGQLPVIATSARDLTNNIGNAGRTAQAQLQEMIAGFKRINEFGQASERQVESLRTLVGETLAELLGQTARMEELTERRFANIAARGDAFRSDLDAHQARALAALGERGDALAAALRDAQDQLEAREAAGLASLASRIAALTESAGEASASLDSRETAALAQLTGRFAQLDDAVAERQQRQLEQIRAIDSHGTALTGQMDSLETSLEALTGFARSVEQRLGDAAEGLVGRIGEGRAALSGADSEIAVLTEASVRLLELIQAGSQHSREHIPAALTDAEHRLDAVEARIRALGDMAAEVAGAGDRLQDTVRISHDSLAAATASLDALHARLGEQSGAQGEALSAIRQTLATISEESSGLSTRIEDELAEAVSRTFVQRGGALAAQIEQATQRASELGRDTTIQLRDQLAKVDELAGNLERRVAHARERAEEQIESDFTRRVALITETLNSNAIDIARAIDSEVSDIAWAAYLKGDRGIFTRRAVSLLEAGEEKAVVQTYEADDGFRQHVNRYIHDFEAMLRQVLSTRDGNALGVTLLSSDMGKLYVALAQGIERLRR